jgi:hypothetical protein
LFLGEESRRDGQELRMAGGRNARRQEGRKESQGIKIMEGRTRKEGRTEFSQLASTWCSFRQAGKKEGRPRKEGRGKEGRPRRKSPERTATHTRALLKLMMRMFTQRPPLTSHATIDRFD